MRKVNRRTFAGQAPQTVVPAVEMTEAQRRTLFMAVSVLLDYPGENFTAALDATESALDELPDAVVAELGAFLAVARERGRRGMEIHYVETFDQRRRCALYLSYYAVGDTRRRGSAIVAFKQQLKALGVEQVREELPDHICVVLEAAARADGPGHADALEILAAHREGIEVLRTALEHQDSPYAHLVRAVCAALPEIDEDTRERYLDLIRSGPPAEMVGIETPLPFPEAGTR